MSKTRRDIQQQLQKDEVAETFQQIAENFRQNRHLLIGMGIALVVGVVIFLGVRSHRASVQADINDKVSAVMSNLGALTNQSDETQRKPNLDATIAAADTLANSYPDSAVGREGLYAKGKAWFFNGNCATSTSEALNSYKNAETAYQAYLERAQTDEEKARGEIALGYSFENEAFFQPKGPKQLEKINAAMTKYTNAVNLAAGADKNNPKYPYLYFYALMAQARLYELQPGQEAKAAEIYQRILKERPAPVAPPAADEKRPAAEDTLVQMIRKGIEDGESQMSFQATAKLRLDRLQTATPAAVTAEVKATPAPAAAAPKTNTAATTR